MDTGRLQGTRTGRFGTGEESRQRRVLELEGAPSIPVLPRRHLICDKDTKIEPLTLILTQSWCAFSCLCVRQEEPTHPSCYNQDNDCRVKGWNSIQNTTTSRKMGMNLKFDTAAVSEEVKHTEEEKTPNVPCDQYHQSTEREGLLLLLPSGSSSLTECQSFQTFIFKDLARDDS